MVIVSPAMNTFMFEHPITEKQLNNLKNLGIVVMETQTKVLMCNQKGSGAMASVEDILNCVYN